MEVYLNKLSIALSPVIQSFIFTRLFISLKINLDTDNMDSIILCKKRQHFVWHVCIFLIVIVTQCEATNFQERIKKIVFFVIQKKIKHK